MFLLHQCNGMYKVIDKNKEIKCLEHKKTKFSSDYTLKDVIKEGNIELFKIYCDARHDLGIQGRKYNTDGIVRLGQYGHQTLFSNTNLLYNICDSVHTHSATMLKMILKDYSGDNAYATYDIQKKYMLKIFDACNGSDKHIVIFVDKMDVFLDYYIPLLDIDTWKKVFLKFDELSFNHKVMHEKLDALWLRFRSIYAINNSKLVVKACASSEIDSHRDVLFLTDTAYDKKKLKHDGNRFLLKSCEGFFKSGRSYDASYSFLKKLEYLLCLDVFNPGEDTALIILNTLEKIDIEDGELACRLWLLYLKLKQHYYEERNKPKPTDSIATANKLSLNMRIIGKNNNIMQSKKLYKLF